ncbi:MAG TPA: hypothetical protein VGJ20_27365, partial [Xanthobacteraceae bacterium]
RHEFLYWQPHPYLRLRRRDRSQGGVAAHGHELRADAELQELLEGSRLRRGDDGDRKCAANGHAEEIGRYLPDRWLADIALFGPASKIREGVEAWRDAGIRTPVLVPLSADGDAKTAIRDVFAAFAD